MQLMPSKKTNLSHTDPDASDEALMCAVCQQDDAGAFGQLNARWHHPIHRLCYRMVGTWQDAEDLTQDVFTKLYLHRRNYRPESRFSSYLWRIAINQCNDFLRARKSRKTNTCDSVNDSQAKEGSELEKMVEGESHERVKRAIGEMPEMYRTVLVLKHYEQLKIKEIANVLEIPTGTVASRLAKALDQLKGQIVERPQKQIDSKLTGFER